MSVMVGPSLPPCRLGGVPVHHDPVHGIVTNPGNREWAQRPLSFFGVWDNPVHRVMVNWDPLIPAGWEAGPNHHGHYGTGFSIFSCTQQPKNLHLKPIYFTVSKHTRYQSWVFLYISLPTKYTISGSILHYKVGLTLSFLSLISRGVGGIQKGNASILDFYNLNFFYKLKYRTVYNFTVLLV